MSYSKHMKQPQKAFSPVKGVAQVSWKSMVLEKIGRAGYGHWRILLESGCRSMNIKGI